MPKYTTIPAKFPGQCHLCGEAIRPGQQIRYAKGMSTSHAACKSVEVPADAIPLSVGQGYASPSFSGWRPGEVVVNPRVYKREMQCPECGHIFQAPRAKQICPADGCSRALLVEVRTRIAEQAEYLVVLTASRRYYSEDGLSFGVGNEQGYVYSAVCRPATEDEARPVREAQEAGQRRRQAAADLRTLWRQIQDEGKHPEGDNWPEGETVPLGKGQDIYGGGAWFVVGPEWIWAILNNGADGDNWSANNVRTGGAGAIGRRVPATGELAKKIRALAAASRQEAHHG